MKHALAAEAFARATGTAPADILRLQAYLDLLARWQRRINLVGASSLTDPWRRHILDSAQFVPLVPAGPAKIVDLGSGAGFPGLVLAVLTGMPVTLVESDLRKCAFLAEAARVTEVVVEIRPIRAESVAPRSFDVVTARALAPLAVLLGYARNWLAPEGICLFAKGRGVADELTEAAKFWTMRSSAITSLSDPSGTVLRVERLHERVDG